MTLEEPLIKCNINGKKITALLDTGARSNFIKEPIVKELGLETLLTDRKKQIFAANGEKMKIEIEIETAIAIKIEEIPHTKYKLKAYILGNGTYDLILVTEFMKENAVAIDYQIPQIRMDGYEIFRDTDETPFPDKLMVEKTCQIKESEMDEKIEQIVQTAIKRNLKVGKVKNMKHEINLTRDNPVLGPIYKIPEGLIADLRRK